MKALPFALSVGVVVDIILASSALAQSTLRTLQSYNSDCDSMDKFVDPACASAIHRYCSDKVPGDAGISQEVGQGVFGVACFKPSFYGDVSLLELAALNADCNNLGKSRSAGCMSAVHQWCYKNKGVGGGVVQEIGDAAFGVACFWPLMYPAVPIAGTQIDTSWLL